MADSHEREPCPHRIIDDLGGAFAFGVVGGGLFHTFKGARNAPRGERTAGAIQAVKANARRLGGSFAVWGGLFSTFDCCFIAIRAKEDPYNSIMSGFCTGATLAARGGSKAAFKSGIVGGVILAVIEGLNIAITRLMNQLPPPDEAQSRRTRSQSLHKRHKSCAAAHTPELANDAVQSPRLALNRLLYSHRDRCHLRARRR
jgi:import inner membrane translocase subunit TIM17